MSTANKNAPIPPDGANGESVQRGTLTRQDIALAIYDRLGGISRREAKRLIDCVIDEMVSTLIAGETLKLHDFGSFVIREKHERSGRNPRTGAPVPIEARRVVVFRASPNMKAAINGAAPAKAEKSQRAEKPILPAAGKVATRERTLDKV
jgi:integration host factor subunit alpha